MRLSRNKYGAKPTVVDGIRFASKIEAARWQELRLLERAGEIAALRRQPKYELKVRSEVIGHYVGDFEYTMGSGEHCRLIVEDVKGMDTPMSRWKRKHLRAQEGIQVEIVKSVRARRAA